MSDTEFKNAIETVYAGYFPDGEKKLNQLHVTHKKGAATQEVLNQVKDLISARMSGQLKTSTSPRLCDKENKEIPRKTIEESLADLEKVKQEERDKEVLDLIGLGDDINSNTIKRLAKIHGLNVCQYVENCVMLIVAKQIYHGVLEDGICGNG